MAIRGMRLMRSVGVLGREGIQAAVYLTCIFGINIGNVQGSLLSHRSNVRQGLLEKKHLRL